MAELGKPRPPGGFGVAGRRLWKAVVSDAESQGIELESLEIAFLEDACRLSDRVEALEAALADAGTFLARGVAGQVVAHPLLGEIRQTRALRAQTLARIKVTAPEEKPAAGVFTVGAAQQRAAANKRWRKG
ncbi:hypothetical protein [Mycobacterium sp. OTB74]|jgi:hypothetical protein|uniref:hypothetical protein n=1 Tax=Mycobacterium sp. OTB74 TaxID=1853452 RepID=UPI0024761E82|nr:hypothetical protein [Mycobacterium sp. OTB74]MDH6247246.1 hypothetical protein [Mycobacterium sp. OTB74]